MIAAVICIPYLIEVLGEAKFGVLTLVWAIISYAGLLDLGLSKAITNKISIFIGTNEINKIPNFFRSAKLVLFLFSMITAAILISFSNPIATHLQGGFENVLDARLGVCFIGLSVPFITLTSIYRGVLEAKGLFSVVNIIRLPMGLMSFILPVVITYQLGPDLLLIIIGLVIIRVIFYVIHKQTAQKVVLEISQPDGYDWTEMKLALNVGAWITLTNIISPLMGYLDRFVLMAMLGPKAVTFYVTPQEIVTKLWIIPGAITSAVFPVFSRNAMDSSANIKYFTRSLWLILLPLFPIVIVLYFYSYEIMSLWISENFAVSSAPILQILIVGIFVNCFSHVPFTYLQATGNAKLTAVIQVVQFPLFIAVLFFSISNFGLIGAAYAFVIRLLCDAILMFTMSIRCLVRPKNSPFKSLVQE